MALRLIRLDEEIQPYRTCGNKHHEKQCWLQAAFHNLFARAARIMKRSASQTTACPTIRKTFPNLWYPPTGGTRVVESRFLTSNPSIYRRVFVHVLGVLFVTAGYFPFGVVAIHLGSFGHVPSRLQLYAASMMCGSTRT